MNLFGLSHLARAMLHVVMTLSVSSSTDTLVASPKADFDFYVMSMSYQPEFCYAHRSQHFPGCDHPQDFWKSHLTIHGLWPERTDGSWPATCSNEPLSKDTVKELEADLEKFWPNVKDVPSEPDYTEFWQHEWSKHGTCSGLKQKEYFRAALDHFLNTPDMVSQHYGSTVAKADLLQAYGGPTAVVAVCSKERYLSEIRACVAMNPDGTPTTLVPCPEPVLAEGNCGDEIVISKFPSPVKTRTSGETNGLRGSSES